MVDYINFIKINLKVMSKLVIWHLQKKQDKQKLAMLICWALQNLMPCAVKNITDKLTGDVANLLAEFVNNVDNFTDCVVINS